MRACSVTLSLLLLLSVTTALGQGRAYRDINFGDSFETVTNKVLDDLHFMNGLGNPARADTSYPQDILKRNRYVLADVAGARYRIYFSFYDDKLFRVSFYSDEDYSANYLATAVSELRDSLVDAISRSRGNPSRTYPVSILDMQSGRITWSHVWDATTEGTQHFIGIGEYTHTFYAAMWIQWEWLAGLYEAALNQTKDDAVDDSASDF